MNTHIIRHVYSHIVAVFAFIRIAYITHTDDNNNNNKERITMSISYYSTRRNQLTLLICMLFFIIFYNCTSVHHTAEADSQILY